MYPSPNSGLAPTLFESPQAAAFDDPEEQRALLALSLVQGVGAARVRALMARFRSAVAVLSAPPRRLAAVEGIGRQTATAIAAGAGAALGEAAGFLTAAKRLGMAFIGLGDPAYPALLARIYDPPPCLWVRGRLSRDDDRAIAIVGTRRATDYGRHVAHHFGTGLASAGFTVVSGLAYGIDITAHRAALEAGGRTIAVLGSGLDWIYPSRHAGTVRRIVDEDRGAVISEFPPGTAPDAVNFPRRNRVVAGLSLGVLVAEARAAGGALLTAMAALEQNREVFAAPAPLFTEMEGANRLIREGAQLVTCPDDIVRVVAPIAGIPATDAPPPPVDADLTEPERRLLGVLDSEPRTLDEVCAGAGLDPSSALVLLLDLEFRGLARQLAGKRFCR